MMGSQSSAGASRKSSSSDENEVLADSLVKLEELAMTPRAKQAREPSCEPARKEHQVKIFWRPRCRTSKADARAQA